MRPDKITVTTFGMSERKARPLLFFETSRGVTSDEAFFLLCEPSPGGRRVFGEAIAQYRRGERIRTPEQYVELVSEISSSCGELLNDASISFATGFVKREEFWWSAGGKFSVLYVSPDGKVSHPERGVTGHLKPGGKLIAAERETLLKVDEGLEALSRSAEEGTGAGPAVVLELVHVSRLEAKTSGEKASRKRTASTHARDQEGPLATVSRLGRLTARKLSPFGWISLVGAIAIIVLLLVTIWPSSRKTSFPQREKRLPSPEVASPKPAAVAPKDTTQEAKKPSGEFALSLRWKKRFRGAVTSSPVVYEGRVYVGCRDGGLYCLDASTGEQVWKLAVGTGIGASPAVSNGKVFVGGYSGGFWCVDASSGQKVWEFKTGAKVVSSSFIASGSVLFGSYDRNLYCVSVKDGKLRWKYGAGGAVWSSPIVEKGRVFFGSVDGTFYCLSLDSGKLLWKYAAAGEIYSSPAVSEGIVCFGSNGRALHFLDASSGKELFRIEARRNVRASPLVAGETVYGASDDGLVRCISLKERAVRWTFQARGAVRSTPFLSEGMLYVTSYDGKLYALEISSGKEAASFDAGAQIYSSPSVSGGMVYFGVNNGDFYCLQAGSR